MRGATISFRPGLKDLDGACRFEFRDRDGCLIREGPVVAVGLDRAHGVELEGALCLPHGIRDDDDARLELVTRL